MNEEHRAPEVIEEQLREQGWRSPEEVKQKVNAAVVAFKEAAVSALLKSKGGYSASIEGDCLVPDVDGPWLLNADAAKLVENVPRNDSALRAAIDKAVAKREAELLSLAKDWDEDFKEEPGSSADCASRGCATELRKLIREGK